MSTHVAYCVRAAERAAPADPMDDAAVPVAREMPAEEVARAIRPDGTLAFLFDGLRVPVALPPLAGAILRLIDGERRVGEIAAALARARHRPRRVRPRLARDLGQAVGAEPHPARPPPAVTCGPAIVIFGAAVRPGGRPSGALRRRVEAALAFGARHPDALYVPTGGLGDHPPAEAEVMAALLRAAGVADGPHPGRDQRHRHGVLGAGGAPAAARGRASRPGVCGHQRLSSAALRAAAASGRAAGPRLPAAARAGRDGLAQALVLAPAGNPRRAVGRGAGAVAAGNGY